MDRLLSWNEVCKTLDVKEVVELSQGVGKIIYLI
jgi:hypothetical protein